MAILDHVSHSQINMWQRCPKQWEYRYVGGLKVPPSGALVLGGCYHKALEGNFRQKVTSREDLPVDSCLDMFSDSWNERLSSEELIIWEDRYPEEYKDQGIGLVKEYRETVSPAVQPTKVEEVYVSEINDVRFVCVVDLEDEAKIVIDHKTSARAYKQDDVDKDLQASAEAFALGRAIVFQNHIAIKSRVPRIQIIRSYRLDTDIKWWYEMATGIVLQMKSGIAPPNPNGWHCSERFCGYYDMCRKDLARSMFG